MTLATHPRAGTVLSFPPEDAAMIGRDGDGDRRCHVFRFNGAALRVSSTDGRTLQPFVTAVMFREVTSDGRYAARRKNRRTLRLPDEIAGGQDLANDTPLANLSFDEASVVTDLLGGRLPSEKELDHIFALCDGRLGFPPAWSAWTASRWSLFSYSLTLYDENGAIWREPAIAPLYTDGASARTVLRRDDAGIARRRCCTFDAGCDRQTCEAKGIGGLLTPIVYES